MSKELEDLLRIFALIAVFLFIIGVALFRIRTLEKELDACKHAPADTVVVTKTDTVTYEKPVPVAHFVRDTQYIVIPDTQMIHDTVTQVYQFPREYLVYKDSSYRAVVSGVQPRLDTMQVFPKTTTLTVTKTVTVTKPSRWGLGVQAGCGFDGKKLRPYLGAGVQYNILSW